MATWYTIIERKCPVSYQVKVKHGVTWKRHTDQLIRTADSPAQDSDLSWDMDGTDQPAVTASPTVSPSVLSPESTAPESQDPPQNDTNSENYQK